MKVTSLSTSLPKSFVQEEFMTKTTFRTYLSRILSSSWISDKEGPRFDLNVRIWTRNMEEQVLSAALKALKRG
jgi:hypothetical protein